MHNKILNKKYHFKLIKNKINLKNMKIIYKIKMNNHKEY